MTLALQNAKPCLTIALDCGNIALSGHIGWTGSTTPEFSAIKRHHRRFFYGRTRRAPSGGRFTGAVVVTRRVPATNSLLPDRPGFNTNPVEPVMNSIIKFESQELEIISRDGERWLAAADLAKALDYKSARSVVNVYNRNKAEFSDTMTCIINTVIQDQERSTRIFSLRGAHLIAMLARTEQAKKFRRVILDLLENEQAQQIVAKTPNDDNDLLIDHHISRPKPGEPGFDEELRRIGALPYSKLQRNLMDIEMAVRGARKELDRLNSENHQLRERLSRTARATTWVAR